MALPPFARFLTLLLAAIQFAAPALVSVADGAFAKQVRDPGMHVEAAGGSECTPPHGPDCTVCRYLTGSGCGAPERAADALPAVAPAPIEDTATLEPAVPRGVTRSRAPPTV